LFFGLVCCLAMTKRAMEAAARDSPADEDEEEDEGDEFCKEDAKVNKAGGDRESFFEPSVNAEADGPATKEEGGDEGGTDDHGGIFAEEEEGELHGGVFGMVAADELGFTLGKVKRHAVSFREDGGGEDDEGDEDRDPECGQD